MGFMRGRVLSDTRRSCRTAAFRHRVRWRQFPLRAPTGQSHFYLNCGVVQGFTPCGHGAHVDAMLDAPECSLGIGDLALREIWRMGMEARAQIGLRHAWCQMAVYAQCRVAFS